LFIITRRLISAKNKQAKLICQALNGGRLTAPVQGIGEWGECAK
jgi:hypothetical protein